MQRATFKYLRSISSFKGKLFKDSLITYYLNAKKQEIGYHVKGVGSFLMNAREWGETALDALVIEPLK